MAQHDYNIANQAGAAFRSDLNNALSAIATNNSGSSAPSTTFAYQWHVDDDPAPATLYMRNGANSAWIEVGDATLANLGLTKVRHETAQTITGTPTTGAEFTSIPSWVKKITLLFSGISTNGTDELLIQLGTASAYATTGYVSTGATIVNGGSSIAVSSTSGLLLTGSTAATDAYSGVATICNITGNQWVYSSMGRASTNNNETGGGNSGDLGAALTRLKLIVTGANTFDAGGIINAIYES